MECLSEKNAFQSLCTEESIERLRLPFCGKTKEEKEKGSQKRAEGYNSFTLSKIYAGI